ARRGYEKSKPSELLGTQHWPPSCSMLGQHLEGAIMRHVISSVLGLAAVSLLAGCPDRTISEVIPEQGTVEYKEIPQTINRNIDILFVIDDSVSMADKQANLAANFPNFINVLDTIEGGLPD